jgi:hypothetical protein
MEEQAQAWEGELQGPAALQVYLVMTLQGIPIIISSNFPGVPQLHERIDAAT